MGEMPRVTSYKQLQANRRNARLCTGPRTAAGKARSALNHAKHGFQARSLILETPIAGETQEDFDALQAEIIDWLRPSDLTERRLVARIVEAKWMLRRAMRYEAEIFSSPWPTNYDLIPLVRFECSWNRRLDRAWSALSLHRSRKQRKKKAPSVRGKNEHSKPSDSVT